MIDHYALEVNVPAIGKTFEFLIPAEMNVLDAKGLIYKMIAEQCPGFVEPGSTLWYIDVDAGMQVPDKANLREAGLKSGSRLMLLNVH